VCNIVYIDIAKEIAIHSVKDANPIWICRSRILRGTLLLEHPTSHAGISRSVIDKAHFSTIAGEYQFAPIRV